MRFQHIGNPTNAMDYLKFAMKQQQNAKGQAQHQLAEIRTIGQAGKSIIQGRKHGQILSDKGRGKHNQK
jgi:hypothetical protein